MRITLVFTAALTLITLVSCKDKNKSVYEGCCGTEPTTDAFLVHADTFDNQGNMVDTVFKANIFIPNIFTPDINHNIGINETFKFFFGPGILNVKSAVYSNENGETLYEKFNFLPDQDDLLNGWTGVKPDGTIHYGLFNYRIEIEFVDGQTKTYTGQACAYKCEDDGFPAGNIPNCLFPTQNNGNGMPDPNQPGSQFCIK